MFARACSLLTILSSSFRYLRLQRREQPREGWERRTRGATNASVATWKSVRAAEHQRILWRRLHPSETSRWCLASAPSCQGTLHKIAPMFYMAESCQTRHKKSRGWRHVTFDDDRIYLHLCDNKPFISSLCVCESYQFFTRINNCNDFNYRIQSDI